jgi:predicted lipoprotein with Yx(FWY)xxD motif
MRTRFSVLVVISFLLLAACGGDDPAPVSQPDQSQPTEVESPPPDEATAAGTVLVAGSDLGDILTDAEGMTLYMFMPDENGEPTCYDDCAATWPPLEAEGDPIAGDGVDRSLLGTVERTDGAAQVTYNDMPLYYFAPDEAAGDTNGQGVGDVWWVVSPSGDPITE